MSSTRERGVTALTQWLVERGWQVEPGMEGRRAVFFVRKDAARRVVRISSKAAGTWQVSTNDHGSLNRPDYYWAIVDVGKPVAKIVVLPEDDVRVALEVEHVAYLARHGGTRPGNPASTHQALRQATVDELRAANATEW